MGESAVRGREGAGDLGRVGVLEREGVECCSCSADVGSTGISSANGFAKLDPRTAAWDSVCLWRRAGSSACGSAAVVTADVSSGLKEPCLSTRSSILFGLPWAGCFALRCSSIIRPRSRMACLALRLRSTASGSSSSRVEASGESSLDSEGGANSSPRLCRAMATLRRDSSTHCRT